MLQEVTGGFTKTAPQDLEVAWQLLLLHVDKLEGLARRLLGIKEPKPVQDLTGRVLDSNKRSPLALDPRDPGDRHVHVNLVAPTNGPGIYMVPIFVALAALVMGVKVRGRQAGTVMASGWR